MTSPTLTRTSYRIIIIDDNQAIHDDLRKIFAEEVDERQELLLGESLLFGQAPVQGVDFEIDSAYQGESGLALLKQAMEEVRRYAMAFVDIRMPPGWDGVETIRRLWEVDPDLQVVICTAYSDYSWNDIVTVLGQSDSLVILKKPFDNIEVLQLAHALTRKWSVSREARMKRQDLERMVREATAELSYSANHDALTGLPNRRLFEELLLREVAVARRNGKQAGVLYIDLDGFKLVNDSLGHAVGDRLLCDVACRLQSQLRECDELARMGGDEFVLIAGGLTEPEMAATIGGRLLETLRHPFCEDGNDLSISASIGISVYPKDGRDAIELLRNADAAMYEAKRLGKNRTEFYRPEIGQAVRTRLELESGLKSALDRREFVLHYQPQVDLRTHRLVRFEALLRWLHPTLGLLAPDSFISIAEESGLIAPIGEWVLREACRTARKWQDGLRQRVPVGVNVSARQLSQTGFVDALLAIINEVQTDPSLLELELTEALVVHSSADVVSKIHALRAMGVKISIDDFGTGYSSFSYLRRFPVDAIKIDRSFIQDLESEPRSLSVVQGMVSLAHAIGLRVVVEGVETPGQMESLLGCGADEVQGFLLGCPQAGEWNAHHATSDPQAIGSMVFA